MTAALPVVLSADRRSDLERAAWQAAQAVMACAGDPAEACWRINARDRRRGHRLVVRGEGRAEVSASLLRFARTGRAGSVSTAVVSGQPAVAFLFTGQGAQYQGMGAGLFRTHAGFAGAMRRAAAAAEEWLPEPLLDHVYPGAGGSSRLTETVFTQPALFALEHALAALWASWNVRPHAVAGHSVGEYAAAAAAGAFDLGAGARLVARRGRLMQSLPAGGAMAAVSGEEAAVRDAVASWSARVSIAAVNGPRQVVVSGDRRALAEVVERLEAGGLPSQELDVSHAFHSPQMDPILEGFERVAAEVPARRLTVPLADNLTGQLLPAGAVLDATRWRRHVREPVRFADCLRAMHDAGCRVFVEIGPGATLLRMARRTLPIEDLLLAPSLDRSGDDWETLLTSAAALYLRGVDVDWSAVRLSQGSPNGGRAHGSDGNLSE